jgi:tetratricopeptide (TPR) repeat protein
MADIAKLKKKALEHEQKKQPEKALALYIQILEESTGASADDVDVSLFNRVGDLLVKAGNVGDAVTYYERAVDLYTEGGFLNNAIALCNKILRQSPGRTSVYYKLGKISAQKGFNSDARKNYLEYADRMQRESKLDEAFRALAEFCDLCPGQDDIRLMLADQLQKQGKPAKAIEQLQILYRLATAEGRVAEADAAAERMRAIDPSVELATQGEAKHQSKSDGLVFLDLDDDGRRSVAMPAQPAPPAPAPAPPPAPPAQSRPTIRTPIVDIPLVDIPAPLEMTNQLEVPEEIPPEAEPITGLELTNDAPHRFTISQTPMSVDIIDLEPVEPGKEDAAPIELAADLPLLDVESGAGALAPTPSSVPLIEPDAPVAEAETATAGGGDLVFLTPMGEEVPRIIDEVPSPAADLPLLEDEEPSAPVELPMLEDLSEAEAEAAAAEEEPPAAPPKRGSLLDGLPLVNMGTPAGIPAFGAEYGFETEEPVNAPEGADDIEVAFLTPPIVPVFKETETTSIEEEDMLTAALTPMASDVIPELPPMTRKSTSILARSVDGLAVRVADDPDNHTLRRSYAEALLEDGQRDAGLRELDVAMVGFEKQEDLSAARSLADEIVRVNPSSVRHHQKRVEYCFRLNDRGGLVEAYIELGDALLREGAAEKARAVYQRVLELQPGNARAEAALGTIATPAAPVATETPKRGTTAIRTTTTMKRYTGAEKEPPPEPAAAATAPAGGDDDFVNLGDWLRDDEPTKDTRMIVDEEEPTGDEQADFADMLAKFKQGVAQNVDEEDYDSHYDLGVAYKEMGLLDEAIAEFQKALRGQQHRSRAYESLGQCFVDKGHYPVAATILSRATSEPGTDDAQLVGVLYLLGQTYEALERPVDALNAYQRVFAVDITFRDVAERIGALTKAAK